MNRKMTIAIALSGAIATLPALAATQQPEIYLGGNLGYYRFEQDRFPQNSRDFDDERQSWKVQVGTQLNPVFGLQAAYIDFGEVRQDGMRFDSDGVETALTVGIPFSEDFAIFAKGGVLFWDRDEQGPASAGFVDEDGNDPFVGIGTRVGLAENLDLRLEYDRFAIDAADVDMASMGLSLSF